MKTEATKNTSPWQRCYLYMNNRTNIRATMLQSKDMRLPEFDEDLPHSDMDQRVSPAEKYSQLGESAAAALISSTVATLPAGHPCCVVVDTSPKTGEFARTILRAPASSTALHYIAVGLESQLAWCQQDLKDFALGLYLARALKIKNFEPLPDTADETPDLVLPKPNVGVVDGTNLVVAPDVCNKWEQQLQRRLESSPGRDEPVASAKRIHGLSKHQASASGSG